MIRWIQKKKEPAIFFLLLLITALVPLVGGCKKKESKKSKWIWTRKLPPELAKELSVDELIRRWKTFPKKTSSYGIHGRYAEALGLKGSQAARAVPDLAPYATNWYPSIRMGAMKGLAGIGKEGVPHLIKALEHGGSGSDHIEVRWDAAKILGSLGSLGKPAIPHLLKNCTNMKENVNVRWESAQALVNLDADKAIEKARVFYQEMGRKGMSPGEVNVLRKLNLRTKSKTLK